MNKSDVSLIFSCLSIGLLPCYLIYLSSYKSTLEQRLLRLVNKGLSHIKRNKDSIRNWRVVFLYEEIAGSPAKSETFYGIQVKTRKWMVSKWSLISIVSAESFDSAADLFNEQSPMKLPLSMRKENHYFDEGSRTAWQLYAIVGSGLLLVIELMRLTLLG